MAVITVIIDGNTYMSKKNDEVDKETASEDFYDIAGSMDSFKMELEDGRILVLGKDAIQRAQMIFSD